MCSQCNDVAKKWRRPPHHHHHHRCRGLCHSPQGGITGGGGGFPSLGDARFEWRNIEGGMDHTSRCVVGGCSSMFVRRTSTGPISAPATMEQVVHPGGVQQPASYGFRVAGDISKVGRLLLLCVCVRNLQALGVEVETGRLWLAGCVVGARLN